MNWLYHESDAQERRVALHDLSAHLVDDGSIDHEQKIALDAALADDTPDAKRAEQTPWYMQALAGVSAWLAAFFLTGFLVATDIVESETSAIVVGAILTVIALGLKYLRRQSIFVDQLAFALSLVGQIMLIGGIGAYYESVFVGALTALALETLLYFVYPDGLHRFVSVLLTMVALMVIAVERELPELTHLYTLSVAVGVALVWQKEQFWHHANRWRDLLQPLAYGLPVALFGISLLSLFSELEIVYWWLSALALAFLLLYLGRAILGELELPLQSMAGVGLLVAVVVLTIPAIETPGILAAILVLVVGFWRNNQLLLGLAAAFLLFFLGAYYYNLNITLLNKSFALMATGILLLLLRLLLLRVAPGQGQTVEAASP